MNWLFSLQAFCFLHTYEDLYVFSSFSKFKRGNWNKRKDTETKMGQVYFSRATFYKSSIEKDDQLNCWCDSQGVSGDFIMAVRPGWVLEVNSTWTRASPLLKDSEPESKPWALRALCSVQYQAPGTISIYKSAAQWTPKFMKFMIRHICPEVVRYRWLWHQKLSVKTPGPCLILSRRFHFYL